MPALAEKAYCTGCTACASICPKNCIGMFPDGDGFLHPRIDPDICVECGLCQTVCPVLSPSAKAETLPRAYAAYSRDEAIRLESSSGGIFTEIARTVLADGGAVYGAAYNAQFAVVHICAETEADLAGLRGAKYAQSDLTGIFTKIHTQLNQGRTVLFSGTPCQVAGLKAFLRKDYENLLTVDFVCHSVPSPMAWQAYVKYRAELDNNGEMPHAINLRSKLTGWTNYRYSNLFTYADGHSHAAKSGESLYMKLFVGGYINRESCANCHFKGYSRISDLTVGDFWGVWNIAPEMDDNKGTSLILVQSPKGSALLDSVRGKVVLKPVTAEDSSRHNGAMLNPHHPNERRAAALEMIRSGRIGECENWFLPKKPSVAKRIRSLLGRLLRKCRRHA